MLSAMLLVAAAALVLLIFIFFVGMKLGAQMKENEWKERIFSLRREIANKQRSALKGKLSENFAPMLADFPFQASECRFIGDPVDYVVFEGISQGKLKGVHFVEVKSGNSKLTKIQREIRDKLDSLEREDFSFCEFDFPEETNEVLED